MLGMPTATVSSKGRVTIPARVLRELDVRPGTKLLVVPVRDGVMFPRQKGSLAEALAGATGGMYGDVEEYIGSERRGWT
jgi:AbrB family looped-hinge helix DNA binding protein